jgi:hypothetical protein
VVCVCLNVYVSITQNSNHGYRQVALSRGCGRVEELEQQLQQSRQHASAEQLRCEEACSRLLQLQETLQIKDACLKDATAALNEAKLESRRTAALLQVGYSMESPRQNDNTNVEL